MQERDREGVRKKDREREGKKREGGNGGEKYRGKSEGGR